MSAPGPMEECAQDTLALRNEFQASGELESLEAVECDAVAAFKLLLRDGSPRLTYALVEAALRHADTRTAA